MDTPDDAGRWQALALELYRDGAANPLFDLYRDMCLDIPAGEARRVLNAAARQALAEGCNLLRGDGSPLPVWGTLSSHA